MGSGALPPSLPRNLCLTCRIVSLLFFQRRTSGDFGRWPWYYETHEDWYWELALTLRSGQSPEDRGLAVSETQEEIGHISYVLGVCSRKQIVMFPGKEALHDNSRQQILLLRSLVWSWSQQGQSEMFTQAPTLGTYRDRPLWLGFSKKSLLNSRLWLTPKLVWGPREEWIFYSGEIQAV